MEFKLHDFIEREISGALARSLNEVPDVRVCGIDEALRRVQE